jgi:hypothetical protein
MPHVVSVKEPKNVGGDGRRGNVNVMNGGSVDLTVVRGTVKGQPSLYVRVRGVEMGPDIPRRHLATIVLDAEWDESGASVMFEARRCWRYGSCSWASSVSRIRRLCLVSGASSIWYLSGSTTSTLTPLVTSTASYTQPFGNDDTVEPESVGEDTGDLFAVVVGRRNRSGILVVFEGVDEVSCQRCGLRTIEVNPRHAVGRNGSRHWSSRLGWGEVEGWIWDDGGMPMAIHLLFSASSTASEILVGGRVIGRSPADMRCCRRSSQARLRSISCSRFQASACLTPSPFGRGVRNSKRFSGFVTVGWP